MKEKVAVGISGGVDSAVALLLLKEKGYDVVALNMRLWEYPSSCKPKKGSSCCSPEDIEDAKKVAQALKVPFYVVKMEKPFYQYVIQPFLEYYARGETPNPCANCNTYIKFGDFYEKVRKLGFSYVATGHYARVKKLPSGRYAIFPAKDGRKNQAYYLYGLSQEALSSTLFPIGELTKEEVRKIAQEKKLPVAKKPESQEICFIPEGDYRLFLKRQGYSFTPGYIRDTSGKILGRHQGKESFTIGQRRGLGIAVGKPLYVVAIEKEDVIVGEKEELAKKEFWVEEVIYQGLSPDDFSKNVPCMVQVRYRSSPQKGYISFENGKIKVELESPVYAVTPGQIAVFYHSEEGYILAGGKIVKNSR